MATDHSPPLGELLAEGADLLWPVVLVSGFIVGVQWMIHARFKPASQRSAMTGYFAVAGMSSAFFLASRGELAKAWDHVSEYDDQAKYLFTVVTVAAAYFLFRLTPSVPSSGGGGGGGAGGGRLTAKPELVTYPTTLPDDAKEAFVKICGFLEEEAVQDIKDNYEGIPEQLEWVTDMLAYNVRGGKMNRGTGVVDVQRAFARQQGRSLTHEEVCRANVLGWCVEWLQAFFLVADDVMDKSLTRRGQPCWYKVPKVQEIAINDSFILEAFVFKLLKRHFGHEAYYLQLVELFHDVVFRTEMGQLLDLTSQPMDAPADMKRFTLTRYRMIVKYKTAYYTFYLPCAIGMIYAGVTAPESFVLAREICCQIGEYFQIQDDYLDCFGEPETIGKVGTDIQDNKCSWLVVQALDRASDEQRARLEANYAQHDDAKVEEVKKVYRELDLEGVYKSYEEESFKRIKALIADVKDVPHEVFNQFIDKIHGRSK